MKFETIQPPDPFKPYGSNPVTMESINVRERHAIWDEESRYRSELLRMSTIHTEKMEAIKAAFHDQRNKLIAANFAKRDAA